MDWGWQNGTMTTFSDGRVLAAGGVDQDGQPLAKAAIYNYNTNAWTQVPPMQQARNGHAAFLLSRSRVLVAGGGDSTGKTLDTSEVFDPVTNIWTPGPRLANPRSGYRVVALEHGQALAIGGSNGNGEIEAGTLATCDLFIPSFS
jgi:hypothetical protein